MTALTPNESLQRTGGKRRFAPLATELCRSV